MSQPVSRHTYMFPAEIWLSIGSYLVNKPFELESGNRVEVLSGPLRTCSVETESRRDHIVQEMKRNQATLHNLSLSCTNIARAIQELLYQSILIADYDALILLFRTLFWFPHSNKRIKHITCLVTLKHDPMITGFHKANSGNSIELFNSFTKLIETCIEPGRGALGHLSHENRHILPDRVGEYFFGQILVLSPNLESLVLQVPRRIPSFARPRGEPKHFPLYNKMCEIIRSHTNPLQHLRTLKLVSDTDEDPREGLGQGLSSKREAQIIDNVAVQNYICASLFRLPSLEKIEVLGHSIRDMWIPDNIKEASLSGFYRSHYLPLVFNSTDYPRLEKLTLHPFPRLYGTSQSHLSPIDGIGFLEHNEMLANRTVYHSLLFKLRNTLKVLDLQTMGRWSALSAVHIRNNRCGLRCLPHMPQLRHLIIETGALIGGTGLCNESRLASTLPPGLETLTLIERWDANETCKEPTCQRDCIVHDLDYAARFLGMLAAFSRAPLPKLRRFVMMRTPHWSLVSHGEEPVPHHPDAWNPGYDICMATGADMYAGRVIWFPGCQDREREAEAAAEAEDKGEEKRDTATATGRCTWLSHQRAKSCEGPKVTWNDIAKEFAENGVHFDTQVIEPGKYYTSCGET